MPRNFPRAGGQDPDHSRSTCRRSPRARPSDSTVCQFLQPQYLGDGSLRLHLSRRPVRLLQRAARQRGALSRAPEGRGRGAFAVLCRSTRRRQYRTDGGQPPPHVGGQSSGRTRGAVDVPWSRHGLSGEARPAGDELPVDDDRERHGPWLRRARACRGRRRCTVPHQTRRQRTQARDTPWGVLTFRERIREQGSYTLVLNQYPYDSGVTDMDVIVCMQL